MNEQIESKLIKRVEVSPDSVIYTFELPENMTLGLNLCKHIAIDAFMPTPDCPEGEEVGRKYTPISEIHEKGSFSMVIKTYFKEDAYPCGGLLTQYLNKLNVGQTVKIRGPFGKASYFGDGRFEIIKSFKPFILAKNTFKTIVMLAGGTGIAPMFQMIQAASTHKDTANFILLYSNKSQVDILLREELDAILKLRTFNFTLIYTLTREKADSNWTGERGRIGEEMIRKFVPLPSDDTIVLTCGTIEMTAVTLIPLLKKMGYKADHIHDF